MSNTPARPCTTMALLCTNSLLWISTPSATCLSMGGPSACGLQPIFQTENPEIREAMSDLDRAVRHRAPFGSQTVTEVYDAVAKVAPVQQLELGSNDGGQGALSPTDQGPPQ